MKMILLLLLGGSVMAGGLNFENEYVIHKEYALLLGFLKSKINVLDLSNKNLDNIEYIQYLIVQYKGDYCLLEKVDNLYLKLANNDIKSLSAGVKKLDLVKLDVRNNKNLVLPEWLCEMKKLMYIKKD